MSGDHKGCRVSAAYVIDFDPLPSHHAQNSHILSTLEGVLICTCGGGCAFLTPAAFQAAIDRIEATLRSAENHERAYPGQNADELLLNLKLARDNLKTFVPNLGPHWGGATGGVKLRGFGRFENASI